MAQFFICMEKSDIDDAVETVQLEAQVMMRIAKHCRQQAPLQVSGQLLGLDVGETLHATNCFPYKAKQDDVEENVDEAAAFQSEMLHALRKVNADSNTLGWYCSAVMGNFISDNFISTQLATQRAMPKSVALVYDPVQAAVGKQAFKAYRLDLNQRLLESTDVQTIVMSSDTFIREIPIVMRASPLVELFFHEYLRPHAKNYSETLNVISAPLMENNMRYLIDSLEEFQSEQQRMQLFERQNRTGQKQNRQFQQNAPRMGAPRPLDQMLIAKQIQNQCANIEEYAEDANFLI